MEQPEDIGTKADLVRYRLNESREALRSAQILFEAELYKAANNRAYYSIFYAINAIHGLDGNGYKRHKDAIAQFNKDYVKTELFPREIGRRIARAEEIRHASDYDDFYIASKADTSEQIMLAAEFIEMVDRYCTEMLNKQE